QPTTQPTTQPPGHTGAQVAAADPTHSVWVSANAGTGKTHVLIERILRLLIAGTPPGRILCLTFTKAAATEVATRLSTRLGHWAAMNAGTLEKNLKALLNKPPLDEETARARSLFARVLETPEGIRVRNLHSFAESLLSRFPVEAGLAPHFSVIDERRASELRNEARDRLLTGGGAEGKSVRAALRHLAGIINQDQFGLVMRELDDKRARLKRLITSHNGHQGLMAAVRRTLGLGADETVANILSAAAADAAFDAAGLKQAVEALGHGAKTDTERAGVIAAWLAMPPEDRAEAITGDYADAFLTKEREPRKKITTKATKAADPGAEAILMVEQDRLLAVVERLRACAMAEATATLLIVGEALLAGYERIKRTRALLDYDDLIEKAQALLSRGGGVSWVHYKLDGGIDHILVDEAQDTSPEQWRIIAGLTGDFFTGLGAGDQERPLARTVFAVGDEKQSIYSFQGADPARFGIMRDHFREQAAALDAVLPEVELAVSYRSTAAVLDGVDAVFTQDIAADGLTWEGKPIHHHSNRIGQGGLVELWPTLSPDEAPDTRPWDAPLDQIGQASPAARLAEKIADSIEAMWRGKEILESAGRPIEPGDIMILVRTRGAFADIMVRALERRGIPVAGRDRLKLMDHLAVMDLLAVGRFVLLPGDDLTLASVLKGPFIEFDDQVLFDLAHNRPGTLWQALRDRRAETKEFTAAEQKLSALLAAADRTPPYEFYARLLEADGGRRDLLAHLGPEAGEPVDVFLGLALDFERDHVGSLEGFLYWLERGETDVKREMERGLNEVRVLTVHGAKGLESEIVFLPDTCSMQGAQLAPRLHWTEGGDGNPDNGGPGAVIWRMSGDDEEAVSKQLHEQAKEEARREYRRLLYVAMTRARDRLYIGGWEGKNGRPEGCWYDLVEPALQAIGAEIELPTGDVVWRLSKPQQAEPDGAGTVTERALITDAAPDWALIPPPPEPQPSRPLAPSHQWGDEGGEGGGDEPSVISPLHDDGARFKRGLLVHRLLQSLPGLALEDRQARAKAFLARPVLALAPKQQEELLAETLAVLTDPDHAHLFGPGSMAEVPITGIVGDKGTVLSGQVDRLVVTDDAVTVIDFKTNRPPPESEHDVAPAYLRQMAAYQAVLRQIYPDRPVRAVLLWTLGPRLMPLSDDILAAHAP
ncbi:MAG: double-strand break repair helicase AddA, partial [Proteobacteria bacterium]|nr:double-strand break repair helicase AddA [Pseudomonadota bacterium]